MTKSEERRRVLENIKTAIKEERFNDHVELSDPVLTKEEKDGIVKGFVEKRGTLTFRIKTFFARQLGNILTAVFAKDTEIIGLEKLDGLNSGAIITCNHFNPTDNTGVRKLAKKLGKKRINIVVEDTNLAMTGLFGFLMNYADTLPITNNFHYMNREFSAILKELALRREFILIYPERAMWHNYRKPRPMMEGAYYFASKLGIPVISLFTELRDGKKEGEVKHAVHVLDVIYPHPEKSVRDNCREMHARDTELKKSAYEKCYGKALTYDFEEGDVGGLT